MVHCADHKRTAKFTGQPCHFNWGDTWNNILVTCQYYKVDDITKSHSPTWRIPLSWSWLCSRKTQTLLASALLRRDQPGGALCEHDQTSCHLGIKRDTMSCLLNMNDSHVPGDFIMWRWIDRFIQVNAATPMDYNEQSWDIVTEEQNFQVPSIVLQLYDIVTASLVITHKFGAHWCTQTFLTETNKHFAILWSTMTRHFVRTHDYNFTVYSAASEWISYKLCWNPKKQVLQ